MNIEVKGSRGRTRIGFLPVASFRIAGDTLKHRLLPIEDQLDRCDDGVWYGRTLFRGRPVGRFRLSRC